MGRTEISTNKALTSAPTDLIPVTGEAATLHGAGVVVASRIELDDWEWRVDVVEYWGKATAQGNHLVTQLAHSDTHAALLG